MRNGRYETMTVAMQTSSGLKQTNLLVGECICQTLGGNMFP